MKRNLFHSFIHLRTDVVVAIFMYFVCFLATIDGQEILTLDSPSCSDFCSVRISDCGAYGALFAELSPT